MPFSDSLTKRVTAPTGYYAAIMDEHIQPYLKPVKKAGFEKYYELDIRGLATKPAVEAFYLRYIRKRKCLNILAPPFIWVKPTFWYFKSRGKQTLSITYKRPTVADSAYTETVSATYTPPKGIQTDTTAPRGTIRVKRPGRAKYYTTSAKIEDYSTVAKHYLGGERYTTKKEIFSGYEEKYAYPYIPENIVGGGEPTTMDELESLYYQETFPEWHPYFRENYDRVGKYPEPGFREIIIRTLESGYHNMVGSWYRDRVDEIEGYLTTDRTLEEVEERFDKEFELYSFAMFIAYSMPAKLAPVVRKDAYHTSKPTLFSQPDRLRMIYLMRFPAADEEFKNSLAKDDTVIYEVMPMVEPALTILEQLASYKRKERARQYRAISEYENGLIIKQTAPTNIALMVAMDIFQELGKEVLVNMSDNFDRVLVNDKPALATKGLYKIVYGTIRVYGSDKNILQMKSTKTEQFIFIPYEKGGKMKAGGILGWDLTPTYGYEIHTWVPLTIEITLPKGSYGNKKKAIEKIRAFSPMSDRIFHDESTYSTTVNKLCIYETYMFLYTDREALMGFCRSKAKNRTAMRHEYINAALEKESDLIKAAISVGDLLTFCTAKSADVGPMFVRFFRQTLAYKITPEGFEEIAPHDIPNDQGHFLYSKNHVAPCLQAPKLLDGNKEKKEFSIKPTTAQEKVRDEENWAFDFESATDSTGRQIPLYVGLRCVETDEKIGFHGPSCPMKLIQFIESKIIVTAMSKTHATKASKKYKFWAHNGSNYDNLLFVREMRERNQEMEICIDGSSIKHISLHNIEIKDLFLFYSTSLDRLAGPKGFKLQKDGKPLRKLKFPYKFLTEETIDYNGPVPDKEFWNSSEDRETYIKEYGDQLDMHSYIEEYCDIDVDIVKMILQKHLEIAVGSISINARVRHQNKSFKRSKTGYITEEVEKKYDVRNCVTAAQMALNMFKQIGLEETISASPEDIREIERLAYMGGRTEAFVKEVSGAAYYFDINSSYPSSMMKNMPQEFLEKLSYPKETLFTNFVETDIYYCRAEYTGENSHYIPNLLTRVGDKIIGLKNSGWGWRWGVELINAKKHCNIWIKEQIRYDPYPIFKEFITALYEMRKKCKSEYTSTGEKNPNYNEPLGNFLKLIMNSLYGKFGQKKVTETKLLSPEEFFESLELENMKLKDYISAAEDTDGNSTLFLAKFENVEECKGIGNLVRFSSYIAASSRTKLAEGMDAVGHENVCYCDTDSIITKKLLPAEMIDGDILGAWKNELGNDYITQAYFAAPKAYQYITNKGDICIKGKGIKNDVLKKACKEEPELYKRVTEGGEIQLPSTQFKRDINGVTIVNSEKVFQSVYNKRVWNPVLGTSSPFENVEEWQAARYIYDEENKEKKKLRIQP